MISIVGENMTPMLNRIMEVEDTQDSSKIGIWLLSIQKFDGLGCVLNKSSAQAGSDLRFSVFGRGQITLLINVKIKRSSSGQFSVSFLEMVCFKFFH